MTVSIKVLISKMIEIQRIWDVPTWYGSMYIKIDHKLATETIPVAKNIKRIIRFFIFIWDFLYKKYFGLWELSHWAHLFHTKALKYKNLFPAVALFFLFEFQRESVLLRSKNQLRSQNMLDHSFQRQKSSPFLQEKYPRQMFAHAYESHIPEIFFHRENVP